MSISFNTGFIWHKGEQVEIGYCHILFATLEDAQQAHRAFHKAPGIFEPYATYWWRGGVPFEPARDMNDLVNGRYLPERWGMLV